MITRLTKFEKARVIGERADQLSYGAPPCIAVDTTRDISMLDLAEMELDQGKCPMFVIRTIANKQYKIDVNKLHLK